MTSILVKKLLRDARTGLIIVALLLFLFQLLWARVTHTVSGELLKEVEKLLKPVEQLAPVGMPVAPKVDDFIKTFFSGPGQIIQKLIGGESIDVRKASDLLSSGYVHPLVQTILCIWAIGRAAGAIAGEIDRGTMELLLAQPITRHQLLRAHLYVDFMTIPILCAAMLSGSVLGAYLVGLVNNPEPLLRADPWRCAPALVNVALLVFAVSGATMWLSAAGRFRGRVLGAAVVITLVQFLVNVIGQLWTPLEPFRPFTVFYYFQPQPIILKADWYAIGEVWRNFAVLLAIGAAGYALAWRVFLRRDLPAPL